MRTPRVDKYGFKQGAWSAEEDQKLIDYISRYRIWNWSLMPKFAGLARNGKSCRLRWVNYLDPSIRRGNITKEEEQIIIDMYTKLGSRWSKIAARLPGRTDNEIKNYWHTHLKKLFKEEPKKKIGPHLAIEIPRLEAILEDSYSFNHDLIPSASASDASYSQYSNNPTMTPYTDASSFSFNTFATGSGDFQVIDQVSTYSSETTGDFQSFWAQLYLAGNDNMEYERKEEHVQEWYQEPLSPYGIFNNEYWLNEFAVMDAADQPNVYFKDEF